MTESHSEDSPLLGANEPSSPGGCSPSPRGESLSWSSSFIPSEEGGPISPWPPGTAERLQVSNRGVKTAKLVHSQTSMDSGCDCDPTEGESAPSASLKEDSDFDSGCCPVSSTKPEDLEYPSAGPSGCVAPLAQRESLDCPCSALEHKCVCESPVSTPGDPPNRSLIPHPVRVEHPKVSFRIEGFEEGEPTFKERHVFMSPSGVVSTSQRGPESCEFSFVLEVTGTSFSKSGMSSTSSSTASMPMCRICHFPQGDDPDTLISPCRCSGTMKFIHESCLMKWLDVSKSKKSATCELCNYQYNRHKKFRLKHWQLPHCSKIDKILHLIFLICLIVMSTCATITIYCFKQDKFTAKRENSNLSKSEIVTLTCGVLFFVAFFLAMYVEVKAKDTLYRLFSRFVHLNQTWHIDEYDKQRDLQHAPV